MDKYANKMYSKSSGGHFKSTKCETKSEWHLKLMLMNNTVNSDRCLPPNLTGRCACAGKNAYAILVSSIGRFYYSALQCKTGNLCEQLNRCSKNCNGGAKSKVFHVTTQVH